MVFKYYFFFLFISVCNSTTKIKEHGTVKFLLLVLLLQNNFNVFTRGHDWKVWSHNVLYCRTHAVWFDLVFPVILLIFVDVLLPSLSPVVVVLALIISKSVRMLGRLTFSSTTPMASLSLRFIVSVFLLRAEGTCVGKMHGEPNVVVTRLWWFGAISGGSPATLNSS